MFYSMLHRPVTDLFGVFNKHSPFVFLSSHFEKQNDKKKKTKKEENLEADQTNLISGDRRQISFCQFHTVTWKKKKSRVRRWNELKCHCAAGLMSQCCRALLKLPASQPLHHCLQAQEVTFSAGHPSCCSLLLLFPPHRAQIGPQKYSEWLKTSQTCQNSDLESQRSTLFLRLKMLKLKQTDWWHHKTIKAPDGL